MPTYNHRKNIKRAIDSVYAQDHDDFEIVLCDDCSTDTTIDYLLSIKKNYDERLKIIINEENLGPARNFNKILTKCQGDFVCFLTGDDVFEKNKLANQVSWFKRNGESAVLCGHSVRIIDEVNNTSRILKVNRFNYGFGAHRWVEFGHQYQAISVMVRRSCVPTTGFDERIPIVNDQKFWIDVIGKSGRFGCIPDVLATYNRTKGGLTANVRACWQDLEQLYSIIEIDYPEWADYCKRGRINQISYGEAMLDMMDLQIDDARKKFLKVFLKNPRNIKPLIRYLQTFF